ncbi:hypothetical protein LO772_09175 [Yinghuangia sp. ASG 101]|uniref:hypothetical protein n=1 Tax=Yinghuangia sp. ASG 101 TaxID=2896848 RepID=UPI001E505F0D|nr:hypothetical protein [Yinghuangia sp. ASG 101]UGQ13745.1 hypothetical protein LO772_09175 [Yinghuangia sp. ASG 101]
MQPNQPYPSTPPPPAPPAPAAREPGRLRRMWAKSWVRYVVIGLVGFAIGAAVGGSGTKDKDDTAAAAAPQPVVTITVTAPAAPAAAPGAEAAEPPAAAPAVASSAPPAAPTTPPAPAPTSAGPKTSFDGDGTYLVGTDIAPGTYRSDGGSLCYWERRSDTSGEFAGLITNDVAQGPTVVTIAKTDKAFKTQGCADWTKAG